MEAGRPPVVGRVQRAKITDDPSGRVVLLLEEQGHGIG